MNRKILLGLILQLIFLTPGFGQEITALSADTLCPGTPLQISGNSFHSGWNLNVDVFLGASPLNIINSTFNTLDVVVPTTASAGAYWLYVIEQGTSGQRDSAQVFIRAEATVTYAGQPYCQHPVQQIFPIIGDGPVSFSSGSNSVNSVDLGSGAIGLAHTGSTFIYWTDLDCPHSSGTVLIQVDPVSQPSHLAYSNTVICQNRIPNVLYPDSVLPAGGTYASPTGLQVNPYSGAIALGNQSGVHQIVYTPPYGGCYLQDTFELHILPADSATIDYDDNIFCRFEPDPLPSLGTPGGQISVPPNSIAVVDPVSGALDLDSTVRLQQLYPNAPIAINYTVQQQCPNSGSAFITIYDVSAEFALRDPYQQQGTYCQGLGGQISVDSIRGAGMFSIGNKLFPVPGSNPSVSGPVNAAHALVDIAASQPGIDTISFVLDSNLYGCHQEFEQVVEIIPVPQLNISYPDSIYCRSEGLVYPNINTSPPSGVFYAYQSGLSLGNIQGQIIPGSSSPGTYLIHYLPLGANCPDTIPLASVTIQQDSFAQIDFGQLNSNPIFCAGTSNFSGTPLTDFPGGKFYPAPGLVADSLSGNINLSASSSNQWLDLVYDPPGSRCLQNDTIQVMQEAFSAHFAYPQDSVCTFFTNLSVDTLFIGGPSNITKSFFTSSQNLHIAATTGALNPNFSIAGTYDVGMALSTVNCQDTFWSSHSVTIEAQPSANFTYPIPATGICRNAIDPLPVGMDLGGTFSVSSGACVVDSSSGSILLGQSSPGPCTIRYAFPSLCPVSHDVTVLLLAEDMVEFHFPKDFYCSTSNIDVLPQLSANFLPGGEFSASPLILSLDPADGSFRPDSTAPGTYVITYDSDNAPQSACRSLHQDTITIVNGINPIFSFEDSVYCQTSGIALVDENSLPFPNGQFASSPGLSISAHSGLVDLVPSIPGLYTVYFLPDSISCPDSLRAQIRIVAEDTLSSMDYAEDTLCVLDGHIAPVLHGDSTGLFSASTGLVWANVARGEISLDQTPAGTYAIQYQLTGACGEFWLDEVVIDARENALFWYPQDTFCPNAAAPLPAFLASPGGNFSTGAGLLVDPVSGQVDLAGSLPGTYQIAYRSPGRCWNTSEVNFVRLDDIEALNWDLYPDSSICEDDSIEIATRFSTNIEFLLNGQIVEDQFPEYIFRQLSSGDHVQVRYSQNALCYDTVGFYANVYTMASLDLRADTTIELSGTALELELRGNERDIQVHWEAILDEGASISPASGVVDFPDVSEALLEASVGSEYAYYPASLQLLLVPSNELCIGLTDTVLVQINPEDANIFIPEVFTPNNDAFNDCWKIQWVSEIDPADYRLELFNRSYGKVLDMQPLRNTWNGDNLADGVYRWILRGPADEVIRSGGLTIRRQ